MGVIHGSVLAAGGKPAAGARVYFVGGPEPLPEVAALTGADGRFALSAQRPGRYRVGCTADAGGSAQADVDVAAGDAAVAVVLQLR